MPPQQPIDYEQLLVDIRDSREFLSQTAEKMRGEDRDNYNVLLKLIDEKFEQFQKAFPAARDALANRYEELKKRHAANTEKLSELQAMLANPEAYYEVPPPPPEPTPGKPVDPDLGQALRNDLLHRFRRTKPTQAVTVGGNAWQDWNLADPWFAPSTPE